jgi:endo-1,4-beta-D-glucanase Y
MKKFMFLVFAAFFFFACTSENNNGGNPGNNGSGVGSYAVLPANVNKEAVRSMYNSYMAVHYVTYEEDNLKTGEYSFPDRISETARIKASYSPACSNQNSAGGCTCSEAIGYGMFLAAAMDDWDKFNKLLKYSKAFRISSSIALMRWTMQSFDRGSGGSASDADLDIMGALFIAYEKTGNQSYLSDALEIGASFYEYEIDPNNKLIMPAIHDDGLFESGMVYNISYFSLPVIKMLAKYDASRPWNDVLEANLSYMERVQNAGDGLWPDWSDANGAPKNPDNGSSQSLGGGAVQSYASYFKETPRIPWRIAWYYNWTGDARAKAMLDKGMAFLRGKGVEAPNQMSSFYSYQGNLSGSAGGADIKMWASLCALGMGSDGNKDWLNACNERLLSTNVQNAIGSYYANSLLLLYAVLLNGMY